MGWASANADRLRMSTRAFRPLPATATRRQALAYGVALPFTALRHALRTPELRRMLPRSVLWSLTLLLLVLLLDGDFTDALRGGELIRAALVLSGVAAVPAFFMHNHFARMAAQAHASFGFSVRDPDLRRLGVRLRELTAQYMASVVLPAVFIVSTLLILAIPLILMDWSEETARSWIRNPTRTLASIRGLPVLLWSMHWIVVEALRCGAGVIARAGSMGSKSERARPPQTKRR